MQVFFLSLLTKTVASKPAGYLANEVIEDAEIDVKAGRDFAAPADQRVHSRVVTIVSEVRPDPLDHAGELVDHIAEHRAIAVADLDDGVT